MQSYPPTSTHQISSFEVALQLEGAAKEGLEKGGAGGPVTAVFIRAPAILEVGAIKTSAIWNSCRLASKRITT